MAKRKKAVDISTAKGKPKEHDTLLLSQVVISSYDAIITKTSEGIITSWNQGAERIYGFTEKEAVGKCLKPKLI